MLPPIEVRVRRVAEAMASGADWETELYNMRLAKQQFSHAFHSIYGIPIRQWLRNRGIVPYMNPARRERMERIRQAVLDGLSVHDACVANQCNSAEFASVFHAVYRLGVREWLRAIGADHKRKHSRPLKAIECPLPGEMVDATPPAPFSCEKCAADYTTHPGRCTHCGSCSVTSAPKLDVVFVNVGKDDEIQDEMAMAI